MGIHRKWNFPDVLKALFTELPLWGHTLQPPEEFHGRRGEKGKLERKKGSIGVLLGFVLWSQLFLLWPLFLPTESLLLNLFQEHTEFTAKTEVESHNKTENREKAPHKTISPEAWTLLSLPPWAVLTLQVLQHKSWSLKPAFSICC